ncbi:MAG: hypothetical protein QXH10_09800 [Ignisphaera sp.]
MDCMTALNAHVVAVARLIFAKRYTYITSVELGTLMAIVIRAKMLARILK